ncbi:MAG: tetratricopeptide repeat protein [Roseiflexus sp.]
MATFTTVGHPVPLAHRLARALLITPESVLIAVLLIINTIAPSIWIGAGITLLTLIFLIRFAALHLASLAIRRARWNAADALATVAYALHPWSPDALALRGMVALDRDNVGSAVSLLRRALDLAPDRAAFALALSSALLEQGEFGEAERAARRALELEPANAVGHLCLAQALDAAGASPETIEKHLREGLAHSPTPDAEISLRCALAQHLAHEGRMAEAVLALNMARAVLPRCSMAQRAAVSRHIAEIEAMMRPRRGDHAA